MFEKPVISLSTSYLQTKYANDGYAMLCRAAELGYEYVELGHSTTNISMEGIIRAVEEGVVKVSSLHNFCPVPPFAKGATPNLFSPATKSKRESELWLRHTRNTLEFAGRFGAKAVVCHCGYLSYFFMRPDSALEKFKADAERLITNEILSEEKQIELLQAIDRHCFRQAQTIVEEAARHAAAQNFDHLISDLDTLSKKLFEVSRIVGDEQIKN